MIVIFISLFIVTVSVALYFFPPNWENFFTIKKPRKFKKRVINEKSKYIAPKLKNSTGSNPLVETFDDAEL